MRLWTLSVRPLPSGCLARLGYGYGRHHPIHRTEVFLMLDFGPPPAIVAEGTPGQQLSAFATSAISGLSTLAEGVEFLETLQSASNASQLATVGQLQAELGQLDSYFTDTVLPAIAPYLQ